MNLLPNPRRVSHAVRSIKPWAKIDTRGGGFQFGADDRTPVAWLFGRSRELPKGSYVWWLPNTEEVNEFVRAQKGKKYIATKLELTRDMQPGGKFRKNPARIRRAKVTRQKYLSRPSQITRSRPSRRLSARRSQNLRSPEPGFFPNPGDKAKFQRNIIELVGTKTGTVYIALDPRIGTRRELRGTAQRLADKFKEPISVRRRARLKKNPIEDYSQSEIDDAAGLRESFSGHRSDNAREVKLPLARVGLEIGPVLAVAYETTRDGKREKYLHEFRRGARPTLAASSDGRSLFLLGGAYRFTERGIVDK